MPAPRPEWAIHRTSLLANAAPSAICRQLAGLRLSTSASGSGSTDYSHRQYSPLFDIPALDRTIKACSKRLGCVFLCEGNVQVLPGHGEQRGRDSTIVTEETVAMRHRPGSRWRCGISLCRNCGIQGSTNPLCNWQDMRSTGSRQHSALTRRVIGLWRGSMDAWLHLNCLACA